ncbi:type IA DNA topoisomerase [Alkalicoccus daliensis]|uniref:DNA topoisomerase n=1 Tax=Alkalicoccus daliensis TaxID=745820 RepID=A0A1H0AK05_9BACI|nr:type IA DNA topoisomerase [Alkalicoccus daliensis]SDN33136.1 DNA topoisomerase-3 [Alkalicoccus daliensis]
MQLIIAEKPDQAKKLAAPFQHQTNKDHIILAPCETFSQGAVLTWALGHLLEPVPPETYRADWKRWNLQTLPMIPEDFRYRVKRRREFNVIYKFAKDNKIKGFIHAGDAEREGEAIVRLIIEETGVHKPIKRLWISSLTPQAVLQGFQTLKDGSQTESLHNEAVSRAYADWVIGLNATRLYTLLMQKKGINAVFTVGRVQTPTLCLIVKREHEIASFTPVPYWEVKARFQHEKGVYEGTWHKKGESKIETLEMAEKIHAFVEGKDAQITSFKEKIRKIKPPLLFSLSTLQSYANKAFQFSPKKTLDTAQKLYTKGLLTYPRTDSSHVTKEEAQQFPRMLNQIEKIAAFEKHFPLPKQTLLQDKRYVDAKKVKDHYAIIPTEEIKDPGKLSADEKKIYEAVILRLLAAHENDAEIKDIHCETLVDERATFKSNTSAVMKEGWKRILPSSKEQKTEHGLTALREGLASIVSQAEVEAKKTKAPKRYTEGDLIQLMKTCGRELDPELAQVLKQTEGLGTEATRAGIITVLKDRDYIQVAKNLVYATEKGKTLYQAVEGTILASPEMTAKWEQRLSEIGAGEKGAGMFLEQVKKLSTAVVEKAQAQAGSWDISGEGIPQKKKSTRKPAKAGNCPLCGEAVLDKGNFYGCAGYNKNKCTFTLSKILLEKKLPLKQVKLLLKQGETEVIKGFKKENNHFDAVLKWDQKLKKIIFVSNTSGAPVSEKNSGKTG